MYELIKNTYEFMMVTQIPIVLLLIFLYLIYIYLTIAITYIKDAYPYEFPELFDKHVKWGQANKPIELLAAVVSCTLILIMFGIVAAVACIFWPVLWAYVLLLWLRHKDRQNRVYEQEFKNENGEDENGTGREHCNSSQ